MKNSNPHNAIIGLLIILIGLSIFFGSPVCATDLLDTTNDQVSFFLSPDKERFLDQDYLYVDVNITLANNLVNTINLSLSFATSSLLLESASSSDHLSSFLILDNIDNNNGTYNLQYGINPATSTNQTVAHLKFKKIEAGFTKLLVNKNSNILAHDGFGTDILDYKEIHNIYIVK